jgi:hypothetical protein
MLWIMQRWTLDGYPNPAPRHPNPENSGRSGDGRVSVGEALALGVIHPPRDEVR